MKLWSHRILLAFFWLSGLLTLAAVGTLLIFLSLRGGPSLSLQLIFGDAEPLRALLLRERVFDGLFPAIVGTAAVVILSVSWAIPVGIAAGIYLAEFSGQKVKKMVNFSFDILAAIPSIVIGLFGLTVAIFLHQHFSDRIYPCLLISSVALAVLVLPYIVRTTQLSIEAVPHPMRVAGLSLGASKLQNLYHVLLPGSLSGILSGVILSLGRAAEDTAVIMLTGVVATAGIPRSVLAKYEALPFYIYYISSEYTDQKELMTGFGAALMLLTICALLFVAAHLLKNVLVRRLSEH
jgi:phosphate transport system permease protein